MPVRERRRDRAASGFKSLTNFRNLKQFVNYMPDVNITVDGKKVTAPAGTLLIEACKSVGIEVPSFCYYPNLSLQGACRMCLVKIEKMPKLQTACTTVIGEGMIVTTESDEIRQARKGMVELVARQSSTRLSGMRCRRRMRIAGHDVFLRRRRIQVHRAQESSRRAAVVARGVLRPPAMHFVLSLRARLRRGHGRLGARCAEPRCKFDHRPQQRRSS